MKRYFLIFIICGLAFQFARGQQQNPILDWESLPRIRSGVKIKAYSSTNPTGRTMRDFRNYTFLDGDEYEMIHLLNPEGMIVQLWFTSLGWENQEFGPGRFGRINLYLSETHSPTYIKDRDLYFSRPTYSMPRPLWDTDGLSQWAFPCLPFHQQLKITSSENPHWFQVTAHLYRENRFSESIPFEVLYDVNNRIQDYRGRFPGRERGNRQREQSIVLEARSTSGLFSWSGPGVIRSIQLKTGLLDNDILDRIWVVVDYGEQEKKALEVPLTVFFGGYVGAPVTNSQGLPCGFLNSEFYFFFPMPFWEGCDIYLVNRSGEDVTLDYSIRWNDTNEYEPGASGKFYIQYNENIQVGAGDPDFIHLGKRGSGLIVGSSANLAGSIEGNFRVCIDDNNTPAIETTGGEDYFCHAFGIDVGLCTPFHGGLFDRIGYRFHIIDYIPFLRSIQFTQDHGHENMHDRDGVFRSAVFYYWNPETKLVLSDSLDIGDKEDENKHQYRVINGRSRDQENTGTYEGNDDQEFTDAGRWFNGRVGFTVKIDPDNDGARLRKRINQQAFHQEMEVYVDRIYAGRWFEQGSNYQLLKEPDPENHPSYQPDWAKIRALYRDTEFEIPSELTRGKEEIRIELQAINSLNAVDPREEGYCNEYFYWVYSYQP